MIHRTLPAVLLAAASSLHAAEIPPSMSHYIENDLATWIADAQIIASVREQNARTAGLSEEEVISLDNQWRAEVGQSEQPMIQGVLHSPLSDHLRSFQDASAGRITEIFVMDSVGLNVAASDVTSDYWQGDEAKFQKTFPMGPRAVFVDEIELDESTQRYQGQVSFSVTDPATGDVVGAITFGLDATAFY